MYWRGSLQSSPQSQYTYAELDHPGRSSSRWVRYGLPSNRNGVIDPTFDANYIPVRTISNVFGYCNAQYGWTTAFLSSSAIINDVVQLFFFSLPILEAVQASKGFINTNAYTRIIMKGAGCLLVAAVFYITSAVYGVHDNL